MPVPESDSAGATVTVDSRQPVLTLTNVTKRYGGIVATDDVSLHIYRGERVGLIGPNGAGKTTLIRLISGEEIATKGGIRLLGADVTRQPLHRRIRQGLARTFQITELFPALTVRENLLLGRGPRGEGQDWRAAAEMFALDGFAETPVGELGYGRQRQVELAMSLMREPELLLLDEPAAGLDGEDRRRVRDIIAQLPAKLTLVLIEHDVDLVMATTDRILCLSQGSLIADDTPERVASDPRVKKLYLGAGDRH